MPGELRTVVGKKIFRRAASPDEAVQDIDDVFAAKALPDFDRQSLAAEHVDHRQGPELVAIAKLIVDEVEAPDFVGLLRLKPLLPVDDHLATARPLAPQSKPFLAIEAVNEVLADGPTLSPQQDVDATIAVSNARLDVCNIWATPSLELPIDHQR